MKQQGFILMTIILILTTMTIMVVAEFRWIILDNKRRLAMQRYQERSQQMDHFAEQHAFQMLNKARQRCQLTTYLNDEQIKQYLANNSCVMNEDYHYGMTDLGQYPCVKLAENQITHHWLLSIMDQKLPNRLLQMRLVTPEPEEFCAKKQTVYVSVGILNRRWG